MSTLFGLIGYPLHHSFSPAYFNEKFRLENIDAEYKAFALPVITDFPELIKNQPMLKGLNVTIPYKTQIIPYLDELDTVAKETGAVNCISFNDQKLKGYNTDVIGFEQSLLPLLNASHHHCLILGTGGASRAVKYVLDKNNISYLSVSRNDKEDSITYEALTDEIIKEHTLIINTTPLGTSPETEQCPPLPYAALTEKHLLYDLVYNPPETKFLRLGKAQGATIKNGLEMLHLQAEAGWRLWNQPTV